MKTFIHNILIAVGTLFILGPLNGCSSGISQDTTTLYRDADADGYGDADNAKKFATSKLSKTVTGVKEGVDDDGVSYVENNTDCDDGNAAVSPGNSEVAEDDVDNDCDGSVDEDEGGESAKKTDDDGDGYTEVAGDCDDVNSAINPSATEVCDDVDNDCDSETDEGCSADDDGDGYTENDGDCHDANPAVNPSATEICDSIDNDCDGLTDADDSSLSGGSTFYPDADGDGFGDKSNSGKIACQAPSAYVTDNTDCDDLTNRVKPLIYDCKGNTSVGYVNVDNDCDGETDEDDCSYLPSEIGDPTTSKGGINNNVRKTDNDADGYCENETECTDGSKTGDCDDDDASINPGSGEICDDSKDNDCDGDADEGCSGSRETCDDGSDNDGDALTDCDDSDCSAKSACWGATAVWRGANWEWDDGWTLEYNQLRSYLDVGSNNLSVNVANNTLSLDFNAHVAFDLGDESKYFISSAQPEPSYSHKSYYSVFAYNKYFMRAYNNYAVVNCTDAGMTSSDGLCRQEVSVSTASLGSSTWLNGKHVVVLLQGFDADFEGPNEQSVEAEDLSVKVALNKSALRSSDTSVTVTITSDFNGQTHDKKDYKNTVYFTILAYDGDYVSMETTSPVDGDWNEKTKYETQSTTVDFDAPLVGEDGDNIFAALSGWGFDKDTGIDVNRIGASVKISNYENATDTATVGMSGGLYDFMNLKVKAPDILETTIIGCKSNSVCKVSNGEYEASAFGSASTVYQNFNEDVVVIFTD